MFFFHPIYDKITNKTVKDKKMYNVLIADDNLQIVSILKEYCKKNNFNVTLAYDGEETLEKIRNNKFDIVLLDIMMPKKNEKGVTISGSSQTKTITVNGENVLVAGSDNKITIKGNASMIIVSGSNNKIYVDSVAKITITGSDNKIYYKTSPTKSGKPSVSTSGSDNSVSKR